MMLLIEKYFPSLDNKKSETFLKLEKIYYEWNQKINLISRKDFIFFEERHLLHSLSIGLIIKFRNGSKILDIGTGGGFPGIPLAILYPDVEFTLNDSITKKCKVIEYIVKELDLKNVKIINKRAEDINNSYDFVISRAVASLPQLWKWSYNKISKNSFNEVSNGLLSLKGGDLSREIASINRNCKIWNLSDFFEEKFFETKKVVLIW